MIIGLNIALGGIFTSKATGIAAIAGGLAEGFVLWGVCAMIIGQVAAIVLLLRAFSIRGLTRTLFSLLSICMSVLMLFLVGSFLLITWFRH